MSFQAALYILFNQTLRSWAFLTLQLPVQCAEKWLWWHQILPKMQNIPLLFMWGSIALLPKENPCSMPYVWQRTDYSLIEPFCSQGWCE